MVELLLLTTFRNNKKWNRQISFKIELQAYLMIIKLFMQSIKWLFFWYSMVCVLVIAKNIVMFLNIEWVTVEWTYLLYKNIGEKYISKPPEELENYILSTSRDIGNVFLCCCLHVILLDNEWEIINENENENEYCWSYISTSTELNQLLNVLDLRGVRENELYLMINALKNDIVMSMKMVGNDDYKISVNGSEEMSVDVNENNEEPKQLRRSKRATKGVNSNNNNNNENENKFCWSYISTSTQLYELLNVLDGRGVRENELLLTLNALKKDIIMGMKMVGNDDYKCNEEMSVDVNENNNENDGEPVRQLRRSKRAIK
eukprot:91321_1